MADDAREQQDTTEESKPTDIQLLVTAISQQLAASQRREDRVVALLEHLCITSHRDGRPQPTPDLRDRQDGAEVVTGEFGETSDVGPSGAGEPSAHPSADSAGQR